MFEAKSLFTPLKLVAAILLDDVLGAYPFLLLPDEWFYFLMNQAYFLMNVSHSPRSVSASAWQAPRNQPLGTRVRAGLVINESWLVVASRLRK